MPAERALDVNATRVVTLNLCGNTVGQMSASEMQSMMSSDPAIVVAVTPNWFAQRRVTIAVQIAAVS